MLIGEFTLRTSGRSAFKAAKWNRFRVKGGRARPTFPRLLLFLLRFPSVHQAGRASLPLFQRLFYG
jgi:hypothetical protein